MAEFTQIMNDWARMCESYRRSPNGCTGCPLEDAKCYKAVPCHFVPDDIEDAIAVWANENPNLVYPKWGQWFMHMAMVPLSYDNKHYDWDAVINSRIPEWIAKRLDIAPINQ